MVGSPPPRVLCALGNKSLKGEDVAFIDEHLETPSCQWKLYCVCDGHGGASAAHYVESNLAANLKKLLPRGPQPDMNTPEGRQWGEQISSALAAAFVALDEGFAEYRCTSGTTVSLALVCGWLLTIANVGDSEVYLDTGTCIGEMAVCHKVDDNRREQERLAQAGIRVDRLSQTLLGPPMPGERGIGPLRVWPGGIAVSRSVGDFECGVHVLPVPHIRQIIVPETGARLTIASDGLWDYFTGRRACRVARSCPLKKVPHRLFKSLMFHTDGILTDDTTILVVDILPPGHIEFRSLAKQVRKSTRKKLQSWKDLLSLITYPLHDPEQVPLSLYSDIDVFLHFPRITSRGVAMYRFNKEINMSAGFLRNECHWDMNSRGFSLRVESNAVQAFADLECGDTRDEHRSPYEAERWKSKKLERDGRSSPYGPERERSRRITAQSASPTLVNGMMISKYAQAAMMFRDDNAQSPIQVDPVGAQDAEDILMTM